MTTLVSRINALAVAVRDKLNLMNAALRPAAINVVFDGGGQVVAAGAAIDVVVPFACSIQAWTIIADQSGAIQIDIWKTNFDNAPANSGNSITGGSAPAMSMSQKAQSSVLSGWTTSLSAGDVIRFSVAAAGAITRATLALKVQRS